MKHEIVEFKCPIFGDFKVGDNTVYNCEVLCALVKANNDNLLNKPIVMQAASIIEVCLEEIFYRARNFNREGVPNISEEDRQQIAEKQIDKLAVIIDNAKKYHLLDGINEGVYDILHEFRKVRNKIHIHLDVKGADRNERKIFTEAAAVWALELLWDVLNCLAANYPRPEGIADYVDALKIPRIQK